MRAWSSCLGHALSQAAAYALPGQAVDSRPRICSFMTIVLFYSQTIICLCTLLLKLENFQSFMVLIVSTAPHCIYMALPYGKAFSHHGWVNDKGKVRYEVLEEVKVVEMMPRFFWHQQTSLLWTRI